MDEILHSAIGHSRTGLGRIMPWPGAGTMRDSSVRWRWQPVTIAEAMDAFSPGALNSLVLRLAAGPDRAAFHSLFTHFGPRLKSYLSRQGMGEAEVEDLIQDVMLTLWQRAGSFDPTQANATTWVYTIARNRRIDRLRRQAKGPVTMEDLPDRPSEDPDPEHQALSRQEAEVVTGALSLLNADQADLIRRAFYHGHTHSVIAADTGLPLGTVKSRIRLALSRLRKVLGEQ